MTHRIKSARGDWAKQLRWDMQFAERTLVKQGGVNAMYVVHTKDATLVCRADQAERVKGIAGSVDERYR